RTSPRLERDSPGPGQICNGREDGPWDSRGGCRSRFSEYDKKRLVRLHVDRHDRAGSVNSTGDRLNNAAVGAPELRLPSDYAETPLQVLDPICAVAEEVEIPV